MAKNVFLTYAAADSLLFEEFRKHLKALEISGIAEIPSGNVFRADTAYRDSFSRALKEGDVLIVALSSDFFDTNLFSDPIFRGLFARNTGLKVLLVKLRDCHTANQLFQSHAVIPVSGEALAESKQKVSDSVMAEATAEIQAFIQRQPVLESVEIPETKDARSSMAERTVDSAHRKQPETVFNQTVFEAEDYFEKGQIKWAIELYRKAIVLYREGFSPGPDELREKIHLCSEELLYRKHLASARRAAEEGEYRTAARFFKKALSFRVYPEVKAEYELVLRMLNENSLVRPSIEYSRSPQTIKGLREILTDRSLIFFALVAVVVLSIVILEHDKMHSHHAISKPMDELSHSDSPNVSASVVPDKLPHKNLQSESFPSEIEEKYKTEYFEYLIARYEELSAKGEFEKAKLFLRQVDMEQLKSVHRQKISTIIQGFLDEDIRETEQLIHSYTATDLYDPHTHKVYIEKLLVLINDPFCSLKQKKYLKTQIHALNDLYIRSQFSLSSKLVKQHKYEQAADNLRFLYQNLEYPSDAQKNNIRQKILEIEHIENLVREFE